MVALKMKEAVRSVTKAMLLAALAPWTASHIQGQCPTTIATFPYTEGFEGGAAWTSGGTGNDWAWGSPAKPTINAAAEGTNCWVVGGLTGSSYTDGQQSWLQGPCFNFTAVPNPWISFQIFWECERDYDGLALQYSLNAGGTWTNVGVFGSPAHCLDQNWYNTQYISNLDNASPQQGWSGRIGPTVGSCAGGSGSGGWVTASHCLANLAGQPSVKFRFVFGAGTTCNNFDGIAIDDIFIGNAPSNQADFSFACDGNTVAFANTSALCPTGYLWDFGDPASGAANTSTLENPSHTYPGPGTYEVTLTVSGPCNAASTITRNVSVLELEFVTNEPGCAGGDGSIIALVGGTTEPLDVVWTPGGETTVVLTGLDPGTYGITVNALNACPVQGSVELLPGGSGLAATAAATDVSCNGAADGSVTVTTEAGTMPLSFAWEPAGPTTPSITGLGPGTYTCTVTDATGCSVTATATVAEPDVLTLTPPDDQTLCAGESTVLSPTAGGGTAPFTLTWAPQGPDVTPEVTTTYSVSITDVNGCTAGPVEVTITVAGPPEPTVQVDAPQGCEPHCVTLTGSSTEPVEFSWDLGDGSSAEGAGAAHCYAAGTYDVTLTITDASGCQRSLALPALIDVQQAPVAAFEAVPPVTTIARPTVSFIDGSQGGAFWQWTVGDSVLFGPSVAYTFPEVDCYTVQLLVAGELGCADSTVAYVCVEDNFALYAPNAFTPNGDGINDSFQVFTTVATPETFELLVFDRWGGLVFRSTSLNDSWMADGAPTGVYLWKLRLRDTEGGIQEAAGHVTLVR